jgi:hypothetical protein
VALLAAGSAYRSCRRLAKATCLCRSNRSDHRGRITYGVRVDVRRGVSGWH